MAIDDHIYTWTWQIIGLWKMEETCLETYCTLISEEIIHSLRATTSQKKINVSI